MKRRDFIKSSIFALGGTALMTTGCGKNEIIKTKNQIMRRKYKDITVPLLGFGLMRLPMDGNKIDMVELEKMTEYAFAHGANYFDTAYMYVDGNSETAIGKVLKKYDRKSFILADKSPIYKMNSREDVRKVFDE